MKKGSLQDYNFVTDLIYLKMLTFINLLNCFTNWSVSLRITKTVIKFSIKLRLYERYSKYYVI